MPKEEIERRIFDPDLSKRLIITPLIDLEQIGEGTIDIRLGTTFIVFLGRKIETLDPLKGQTETELGEKIRTYQQMVYCPHGRSYILQPSEFVLGGSLEYLRFPSDIFGYVVGRSSWGRLGLVIEMSPVVHPCFIGVLTFELSNLGMAPIALYPGSRIAQITIHDLEGNPRKDCTKLIASSKYRLSTRPEFSKIYEDPEWSRFRALK